MGTVKSHSHHAITLTWKVLLGERRREEGEVVGAERKREK